MFNIYTFSTFIVLLDIIVNVVGDEECFQLGESSLYSGTKITTMSGLECQRWDKQSPHEHDQRKEMFPERSLCKAKNYCRDPDNEGVPWCYTMDKDKRWEACGIPWCDEPARNNNTHDCYIPTEEERNQGDTCEDIEFRESDCGESDVPEGCETCEHCCQTKLFVAIIIAFENSLEQDQTLNCSVDIERYTGTWHRTKSGRECQRWDEQTPHKHENNLDYKFYYDGSVAAAQNYCRDPDYTGLLWCYTMDPNVRWEGCGIPDC